MKSLIAMLAMAAFIFGFYAISDAASVRGYTKKNGTYVQPHKRTNPDKSRFNNYSTKGNVNPYTGKKGTVDPYKAKKR